MEEEQVSRPLQIAILGFGTVGAAVAARVNDPRTHPGLQLTHVLDRRAVEKAGRLPPGVCATTSIDDVLSSDADVVVEAIGGTEPATEWIRAALLAGKSVVTANKQVVAKHGPALWTLAARQGRQLRFEAAVGGAMPIVRAVADGLAGDRIVAIDAVLNGTTNAVFSQMEAGSCALDDAVQTARARGWSEADPSADLDGSDARAKLSILCALAFGLRVDAALIPAHDCRSVTCGDFAAVRRVGRTIRQVAHADFDWRRRVLTAWVARVEVPRRSLFARMTGPRNAAVITGEHAGAIGIFGTGAGGDATAVAVVSDLLAIARDRAAIVPPPHLSSDFRLLTSNFQVAGVSAFAFAEAV